jgi:hypothetical protein
MANIRHLHPLIPILSQLQNEDKITEANYLRVVTAFCTLLREYGKKSKDNPKGSQPFMKEFDKKDLLRRKYEFIYVMRLSLYIIQNNLYSQNFEVPRDIEEEYIFGINSTKPVISPVNTGPVDPYTAMMNNLMDSLKSYQKVYDRLKDEAAKSIDSETSKK